MRVLVLLLTALVVRAQAPNSATTQSASLIPFEEATALFLLRDKCVGKMLASVVVTWALNRKCSDWKGVVCDKSQHVIRLVLEGDDGWENKTCSTATWDSLDLSALQYLSRISIHKLLEGPIPQPFAQLSSLNYLDLSNNHLTGKLSPSVPLLRNLRSLKLASNKLSGEIPSNMPELSTLDLSKNELSGPIPAQLLDADGLQPLIHLNVGRNQLKGNISAMSSHKYLRTFDVSHNLLSGKLPSDLGKSGSLSALRVLHLEFNSFKGSIPSSYGTLLALEEFSLQENGLTGLIPEFEVGKGSEPSFRTNMAGNDFSCPRPKGDVYTSASDCTCQAGHFSKTNLADDCSLCPLNHFVAQSSKKAGGKKFTSQCTPCTKPQITFWAGASACVNPLTTVTTTTTTTTHHKIHIPNQDWAIAAIALVIVIIILLVVVSMFYGFFQRFTDDESKDATRMQSMRNEIQDDVAAGRYSETEGREIFVRWRKWYLEQEKGFRGCCMMAKKDQTKQLVMANFKKNKVVPRGPLHAPPKGDCAVDEVNSENYGADQVSNTTREKEGYYEQDQVSNTTGGKEEYYEEDQVSNTTGGKEEYYEEDQVDEAHQDDQYKPVERMKSIRPKLSKKEWSLSRKRSVVKFKSGVWEKRWDDYYQSEYYYNVDTDESLWDKPDEYDEQI